MEDMIGAARFGGWWRVTVVKWDVTGECNLSCSHCYNAHQRGSDGLPLLRVLGLIEQASRSHVKLIQFLGGEPLLRSDFPRIADFIARYGPALEWSVSTNAQLLDGKYAADLMRCRPRLVTVSLDGPSPSANDPIRGTGTWKRAITGIEALAVAKSRHQAATRLAVNCVLCGPNARDIADMIDLCADLACVDLLIIDRLESTGRAQKAGDGLRLTPEEQLLAMKELAHRAAATKPSFEVDLRAPPRVLAWLDQEHGSKFLKPAAAYCLAASTVVHIAADGGMNPCNNPEIRMMIDQRAVPGVMREELNVKDHSFDEAYNSRSMTSFFQAVYSRLYDPQRASTCHQCHFFPRMCKAGCPLVGGPYAICQLVRRPTVAA